MSDRIVIVGGGVAAAASSGATELGAETVP